MVSVFNALMNIGCFVTALVSFLYGTRVAWGCGARCESDEEPATKLYSLLETVPAAIFIYFFGFLILFSYKFDGLLTRTLLSLTSAIVLSNIVVYAAMPRLKRKPVTDKRILSELVDGSICRLAKNTLNVLLLNDQIVRFKRSDGWAVVGRDQLRDMNKAREFNGADRRDAS